MAGKPPKGKKGKASLSDVLKAGPGGGGRSPSAGGPRVSTGMMRNVINKGKGGGY